MLYLVKDHNIPSINIAIVIFNKCIRQGLSYLVKDHNIPSINIAIVIFNKWSG